jgi:hypothetical protein
MSKCKADSAQAERNESAARKQLPEHDPPPDDLLVECPEPEDAVSCQEGRERTDGRTQARTPAHGQEVDD